MKSRVSRFDNLSTYPSQVLLGAVIVVHDSGEGYFQDINGRRAALSELTAEISVRQQLHQEFCSLKVALGMRAKVPGILVGDSEI